MPEELKSQMKDIFISSFDLSIISLIEFLGYSKYTEDNYIKAQRWMKNATIYKLTDDIITTTIDIKRKYNTKLADAIIAATAVEHDFTLLTRNTKDFEKIEGLSLLNPYERTEE